MPYILGSVAVNYFFEVQFMQYTYDTYHLYSVVPTF